jgi:hypothetical protein
MWAMHLPSPPRVHRAHFSEIAHAVADLVDNAIQATKDATQGRPVRHRTFRETEAKHVLSFPYCEEVMAGWRHPCVGIGYIGVFHLLHTGSEVLVSATAEGGFCH